MSTLYSRTEMISASEIARRYGQISKKIKTSHHARIVVIKNNKPDHVILDIDEYEFLQDFYDTMEHLEIAKLIKERRISKTIPLKKILDTLGISENELSD